jgi:hypothetical protein
MAPKAQPTPPPAPQLGLPFVQQDTARTLSYYIGIGARFAAWHKRWPTVDSTREEFRAARIPEYDGRRLDRELRSPAPELEADPDYRALRAHRLADGPGAGVDLHALDPRVRHVLQAADCADLFDTIALPPRALPGAVRYATGLAAHGEDELTLRLGQAIRTRALRRTALDGADPRVRARASAVRVRATEALKAFIDRSGAPVASHHDRLADHYLLRAGDDGRLQLSYQLLDDSRHVGRFDVDALVDRLAGVFATALATGSVAVSAADPDAGNVP